MKLYTVTLLYTVLALAGRSAAVVHGIQSLSVGGRFESSNDNRNGYRYNGPAHKYLPAASEPATDALTTTGHWLPHPQSQSHPYPYPSSMQQLPYEHQTSRPFQQQQQQLEESQYNGPYNMQYYVQEQQQQQHQAPTASRQHNYNNNHINTFQYATNHHAAGTSPTGSEFGQTFGLSAGTQHDRYMEPSQRAPPLIGQALPERYQRQPFLHEQPAGDSTANYVQMQSHSYELPPTYSMQRGEWLQQLTTPVEHQEREQAPEYSFQSPMPSSFQSASNSFHASHAQSASTSYLAPPSREFQAPYY